MAKTIQPLQENKKPLYRRNGSGDLDVFEAARYFEDSRAAGSLGHKHYLREGAGRLSLDIPTNNRRNNSIPLQAMMMDDRNSRPLRAIMMDQNDPIMTIKNQKKFKQPSSPGGKLAHFLNSLFNQTYSKRSKSKSKSTTSKQSVKDDQDEISPSGWRRKRRSSISLFRSGNSDHSINNSRTPPPLHHMPQPPPTKTTTTTTTTASYKDLRSYSDHKPTCEITKIPFHENLKVKSGSGVSEKKKSSGNNGLVEKTRVSDVRHDDDHHDHHHKYDPKVEIREFKRFILDDDDDGDSDSSSDLFELTNCDLGYYSSGLPVFETTHMDNIKRGAPIVSS